MSVTGHPTQKRPLIRKSNILASLDRHEPESSTHGHTRNQRVVAELAPERARQRRNDSYPHASVRFKLPNKTTTISTLSGHKSGEESPPLSDAELDFDKAQSDSSDNLSSSKASRYSSKRSEIRRLQQEVVALKEVSDFLTVEYNALKSDYQQQDRLLLAESLRAERFRDLKRKSDADALCSKKLTVELDKIRASYDCVKEHLQCQICLELLNSPWTLAPCGHVGCLECLLNWFTTGQDEEDTTDPIHRDKTCPQCRTLITLSPTPSYILKNIVEEIESSGSVARSSSAPLATLVNPWSKIFPHASERHDRDDDSDDDDDSNEEEETYSDGDSYEEDDSDEASSDSPSESSEYRTEIQARMGHLDQVMAWEIELRNEATAWTEPTWQPPRFDSNIVGVSPDDPIIPFLSAAQILSLLRRGATREMIRLFNLSYDHQKGIIVHHSPTFNIRLGWNISRSSDDPDGSIYMHAVFDELKDYPDRFRIENTRWDEHTVVRLLPSIGGPDDSDGVDD